MKTSYQVQKEIEKTLEILDTIPDDLATDITVNEQPQKEKSILDTATRHTEVTPQDAFDGVLRQSRGEGFRVDDNARSGNNGNTGPQQINAGGLITGSMAVHFADMLLPVAIVLLLERATGKKTPKQWYRLTNDEKITLEPVLQNWLNSVNFNVDNPATALVLTAGIIYGTKIVEAINYQAPQGVKMPSAFPGVKKENRGRHKKDCQCIICKQKRARK